MTPDNDQPIQFRKGAYDPRGPKYPFITMIVMAVIFIVAVAHCYFHG